MFALAVLLVLGTTLLLTAMRADQVGAGNLRDLARRALASRGGTRVETPLMRLACIMPPLQPIRDRRSGSVLQAPRTGSVAPRPVSRHGLL